MTVFVETVNQNTSREYRNDENWMKSGNSGRKVVQLMPGAREKETSKNLMYPYPEPAQVPLGEKPKA